MDKPSTTYLLGLVIGTVAGVWLVGPIVANARRRLLLDIAAATRKAIEDDRRMQTLLAAPPVPTEA